MNPITEALIEMLVATVPLILLFMFKDCAAGRYEKTLLRNPWAAMPRWLEFLGLLLD